MLDIALLRRDPEIVRTSARRRGADPGFVDDILRLDAEYRRDLAELERTKAEKNALSATIGRAADKAAAAAELRPQLDALAATIASLEEQARILAPDEPDSPLRALLEGSPNVLDDSVPIGSDEQANVVLRHWGEIRELGFPAQQHVDIGEKLGILDFERAAKLSGARFVVLRGMGAKLSRAVVSFFLDRAASHGYEEFIPPYLVLRETMRSTGHLSKFADAMFTDIDGDLLMIPTAEVPLTAMYRNEFLDVATLPRKLTAHTPCFRKEAGAAGRDTRGLIRLHQFDKVELVWLTRPEDSFAALDTLTQHAASLLEELEIPHRVIALCGGDTGFNAAKTHDIEVWLPGAQTYREISSCSNCTDFQARRLNMRFRRDAKAKPEFVHTLNGSGLAVGRTLVAILENYQQADGSVVVPHALRPYLGGLERITAR